MVEEVRFPRVFSSVHQWNLYSSSGRDQLGGSFVGQSSDESGVDLVLANVSIAGKFWRAPPFERASEESSEPLSTVYVVDLPSVIFQKKRVQQLISELNEWLHSPKEISIELSKGVGSDQSFAIALSARHDGTLAKSPCLVTYSATVFELGKWRFFVDQSCVRIFFE